MALEAPEIGEGAGPAPGNIALVGGRRFSVWMGRFDNLETLRYGLQNPDPVVGQDLP